MSPPRSFWDFSLAVYPGPGVEAACLALQDQGLDVNVALFIAFASAHGRDARAVLDEAAAVSRAWNPVVVAPLRAARDGLKPVPDIVEDTAGRALRKRILELELEAERLEQTALAPLLEACPEGESPPRALCEQALAAYAESIGAPAPEPGFVESVFSALKKV